MISTFIKNIVSWLSPLLIFIYLESYYKAHNTYTFIFYTVFPLIIILFSTTTKKKGNQKIIYSIGNIILIFSVFIDIAHFIIYKTKIQPSTFFIIFETNISEVSEYINMYMNSEISIILISLLIGYIISLLSFNSNNFIKKLSDEVTKRKINFTLVIVLTLLFLSIFRNAFLPYSVVRSYLDYNIQLTELQTNFSDKKGGEFKNIIYDKTILEETIVLIVGESTNKNHLSLYGYNRNTNPLLNKLEENLLIYRNVISPNTHTLESLTKVFTLGTNKNPEKVKQGSIIQLFNNAGYKTYWISNQRPLGNYETSVTAIASSCDEVIFSNIAYNNYDEVLFKPIINSLKNKTEKKLIIIHLMGTHIKYEERYPEKFRKFKSKPTTIFKSKEAHETINNYDNAVLYNDSIIYSIINLVQTNQSNSCVIYLSDHGEDVYQTLNNAIHDESNPTKPMYEIPFIIWMSDEFKTHRKNKEFLEDRKFSTENFIFSIADLANINFKGSKPEKSIFNQDFKEENRIILKNKIYETYFE